jgi:hypothetical protein
MYIYIYRERERRSNKEIKIDKKVDGQRDSVLCIVRYTD